MRNDLGAELEAAVNAESIQRQPDLAWVMQRGARVRRLRRTVASVSVAAVVIGSGVGVNALQYDDRIAPVATPQASPREGTGRQGATVPPGWQEASEPLAPRLEQANELLSAGTFVLPAGSDTCHDLPERALERLGPSDGFVTVQEPYFAGNLWRKRPMRFSLDHASSPNLASCLSNFDDISVWLFRFEEHGRFFRAYVAVGDAASERTGRAALRILDSLVICDPLRTSKTEVREGECL